MATSKASLLAKYLIQGTDANPCFISDGPGPEGAEAIAREILVQPVRRDMNFDPPAQRILDWHGDGPAVTVFINTLFSAGAVGEQGPLKKLSLLNGTIMETMRLYPIAVVRMRTANQDFEFEGHVWHSPAQSAGILTSSSV